MCNPDAGEDRPGYDGPARDPQFQAFCDGVRASMIARWQRCNNVSRRDAVTLVSHDPCEVWDLELSAGRMTFAATNAAECVTALQSLSCASTARPAICDGVLTGLVPYDYRGLGSTYTRCTIKSQFDVNGQVNTVPVNFLFSDCVPGNFCTTGIGTGIAGQGCSGACVPLGAEGGVCDAWKPCLPGLVCNTASPCGPGPQYCCAQPQAGTGDCRQLACGDGLYCDGSVCKPKHLTGACSNPDECLPPAVCATNPGGGKTCVSDANACQNGAGLGDPCPAASICSFGLCNPDAGVCEVDPSYCSKSADCGPGGVCMHPKGSVSPLCGTCP